MATNPKMMPRQHIGSGSSWRYRCKMKSDGSVSCKDGGVLPDFGFPHDGGKAKEGLRATNNSDTEQHTGITYNMHLSTVVGLAVIPSKGAFRGGMSRYKVEEVDVLATVEEVVVHVSEKHLCIRCFRGRRWGNLAIVLRGSSVMVDVHGKRRDTMLQPSWYLAIVVVQGL